MFINDFFQAHQFARDCAARGYFASKSDTVEYQTKNVHELIDKALQTLAGGGAPPPKQGNANPVWKAGKPRRDTTGVMQYAHQSKSTRASHMHHDATTATHDNNHGSTGNAIGATHLTAHPTSTNTNARRKSSFGYNYTSSSKRNSSAMN